LEGDLLPNLIIFLFLLVLHALITLAYAAIVNIRQTHLREQAELGNSRAQHVLELADGTRRLLITYQLSIILVRFFIAAWATVSLVEPLTARLPSVAPAFDYLIVLALVACLTFILGDLVPEAVGSAHSAALAYWAIYPMRALVVVMSPLVAGLLSISRVLTAAFGSSKQLNAVTEAEIMTLVDAGHSGGSIEEEEKDMIYSVLQLDQTFAREVMVPRIDVMAMDIDTTLDEARRLFIESGFSRIPVYENTIDNIKGILYAKDLLNLWNPDGSAPQKSIRDLIRPPHFVPENKRADELLKELQTQNVHIAIVVDEYGGTAGLVTIEDLIEEIVGDIRDEYDVNEEAEYVQHNDTEYTIDGSMDLDDVNDLLDSHLPTEDSDTLGGFIFTQLGRVPQVGETLEQHNLVMRVESIEGRRIRNVHVTRQQPVPPEETPADAAPETQQLPDQAG
jgi:CBS domain containing-hemolysin-like protein